MNWSNRTIEKMKRENDFRFQIAQLHFCHRRTIPLNTPPRGKMFEICIRLESEAEWCTDTINGEPQKIRFPNVAWKRPGGEVIIRSPQPRDTIAFQYSEEVMRDFFKIGMEPSANCTTFILSPEIESLIQKLRKLVYKLYSPGITDQIDWVCFQLYKLLLEVPKGRVCRESPATIIRNVSMWLQTHYDEPIDMTRLAENNGMSHARFYAEWKKIFPVSPLQYILDLKLEAAAQSLIQTGKSISEIVREVHFSNPYAFHKRFCQRYGVTPGEYRKQYAGKPLFLPV